VNGIEELAEDLALFRVLVAIYQDSDFVSYLIVLILWKMEKDYDET